MSFQLLIFFSCLCAVKAFIIPYHSTILKGASDKSSSPNSCDASTCNSQCKQHGYPYGGICLNGGCYCIRTEGDSFELLTLPGTSDKSSSLNSCDASTCNSQCKQHGYPYGGICLNGGCYCIRTEGDSFELLTLPGTSDKSSSLNSCDASTCNSQCKQHDYPYGGICLNGVCYCIRTEGDSFELLILPGTSDKSSSLNSCDASTCNSQCKQHGYPYGGICLNGGCYCIRTEGDSFELLTLPGTSDKLSSLNSCDASTCNSQCRQHGYAYGGICFFGSCYCIRTEGDSFELLTLPGALDKSSSLNSCDASTCNSQCSQRGYPYGGICFFGSCYCFKILH